MQRENSQAVSNHGTEDLSDIVRITKATGDALRASILHTLADDAYGVLELGEVFKMAQPAISHHLKVLLDAGLVTRRKEGTCVFYQRISRPGCALIQAIYEELDHRPPDPDIEDNLLRIHERRNQQSREFFASHADALAQQRELICAPDVYHDTVTDFVLHTHPLRRKRALEVGPGSGTMLLTLAEHFDQVIGIDSSPEILRETAEQISKPNIRLIEQDFLSLTQRKKLDFILAAMVVHHFASPVQFFRQASNLLQTSGLLVIAELCTHNQEWVKDACGDLWLGFSTEELHTWAGWAGLTILEQQHLAQRNGFGVQVMSFTSNN